MRLAGNTLPQVRSYLRFLVGLLLVLTPFLSLPNALVNAGIVSGTVLHNAVQITQNESDSNPGNGQGGADVVVKSMPTGKPDTWVSKTSDPLDVLPGKPVTYTIRYGNRGTAAATSVRLTDTLQGQFASIFASPVPVSWSGNQYRWQFSSIEPGVTRTIVVRAVLSPTAPVETDVVNSADIGQAEPDATPADNHAEAPTHVGQPPPAISSADLVLSKAASVATVPADGVFEYYLDYGNVVTQTAATGVRLTDTLPSQVQLISASLEPTAVPVSGTLGGQVVWSWPSLGGSGVAVAGRITLTVRAAAGVISGTELFNVADISMNENDLNRTNQQAQNVVIVRGSVTPPPLTAALFEGQQGNGWLSGPVTVTLPVTRGTPPYQTWYRLDGWGCGWAPCEYLEPLMDFGDGRHTLEFWSADSLGRLESPHPTVLFDVDRTGPQVDVLSPRLIGFWAKPVWYAGRSYRIKWAVDDLGLSGVPAGQSIQLRYSLDGGETWGPIAAGAVDNTGAFVWSIPTDAASEQAKVQVLALDNAGNWGSGESAEFIIRPPDASDLTDVRHSNLTDVSFTLSFLTRQPSVATVGYWISGTAAAPTHWAFDFMVDPANPYDPSLTQPGPVHWIRVGGAEPLDRLLPLTEYRYLVFLDDGLDPVLSGSFKTGPTLGVRQSDGAWGQVFDQFGSPAGGAVVYASIENLSEATSGTVSTLLSAVTDEQGWWYIDLASARTIDLSAPFEYASSDRAHLSAVAGSNRVAIADPAPLADQSSWPFDLSLREVFRRTLSLGVGWNAVAVPLAPMRLFSVTQLVQAINGDGVSRLAEVARYRPEEGWRGALITGTTLWGYDFDLRPGEGYFLRLRDQFDWQILGFDLPQPIPLRLRTGWNLVGVPASDGLDATHLSDAAGVISGTNTFKLREVSRWIYGTYEGHVSGYEFNSFPLVSTQAYFIRAIEDGTLVPGEWEEYRPFDWVMARWTVDEPSGAVARQIDAVLPSRRRFYPDLSLPS